MDSLRNKYPETFNELEESLFYIDLLVDFAIRYFIIISKSVQDYTDQIRLKSRLIFATLLIILSLVIGLRYGISAIMNR